MYRKNIIGLLTPFILLAGMLLPAQAASDKAVSPMLGLLLGSKITCGAHDPITILSIHADRYSPFNPVTLGLPTLLPYFPGQALLPMATLKYRWQV